MEDTDGDFRVSLRNTKRIHGEIKKREREPHSVTRKELQDWKNVVFCANLEISKISKRLKALEERSSVERAVMKEEMRCELVDREANNARTADRFRCLSERDNSSLTVTLDRARAASTSIECSIGCLCPHPGGPNQGTQILFGKARTYV